MDKCKTRLGYNAVPPPYTGNFMSPKLDLVYPSLDDFVDESISESIVKKPTVESNEPKTVRKENRALIIEDWVSESEEEVESKFQIVKPNFTKIKFVKPKTNRKPVEQIRQDTHRSPRRNKRNWNQHMSQKLGNDFEMSNKACYLCGSFEHLRHNCTNWSLETMVHQCSLKDLTILMYKADPSNSKGGKIIGKGKIRTGKLDFKDVYFVKELKFNLFSVSQMCDKNNNVLFTDTACVVLSPDFKLTD
uniref:Ribonuclease H-like domain-containing protein n=1 Tax=Tanacetum cinerariifolium TaxID=118510 RepID=A0A699JW21_TANCI|nr:ribonuclease H-like domain-containing protein [Tanacetum cinerariifolium]